MLSDHHDQQSSGVCGDDFKKPGEPLDAQKRESSSIIACSVECITNPECQGFEFAYHLDSGLCRLKRQCATLVLEPTSADVYRVYQRLVYVNGRWQEMTSTTTTTSTKTFTTTTFTTTTSTTHPAAVLGTINLLMHDAVEFTENDTVATVVKMTLGMMADVPPSMVQLKMQCTASCSFLDFPMVSSDKREDGDRSVGLIERHGSHQASGRTITKGFFDEIGTGGCRGMSWNDKPASWYEVQGGFDGTVVDCEQKCTAKTDCKAVEYKKDSRNTCVLWTVEPHSTSGDAAWTCMKKIMKTMQVSTSVKAIAVGETEVEVASTYGMSIGDQISVEAKSPCGVKVAGPDTKLNGDYNYDSNTSEYCRGDEAMVLRTGDGGWNFCEASGCAVIGDCSRDGGRKGSVTDVNGMPNSQGSITCYQEGSCSPSFLSHRICPKESRSIVKIDQRNSSGTSSSDTTLMEQSQRTSGGTVTVDTAFTQAFAMGCFVEVESDSGAGVDPPTPTGPPTWEPTPIPTWGAPESKAKIEFRIYDLSGRMSANEIISRFNTKISDDYVIQHFGVGQEATNPTVLLDGPIDVRIAAGTPAEPIEEDPNLATAAKADENEIGVVDVEWQLQGVQYNKLTQEQEDQIKRETLEEVAWASDVPKEQIDIILREGPTATTVGTQSSTSASVGAANGTNNSDTADVSSSSSNSSVVASNSSVVVEKKVEDNTNRIEQLESRVTAAEQGTNGTAPANGSALIAMGARRHLAAVEGGDVILEAVIQSDNQMATQQIETVMNGSKGEMIGTVIETEVKAVPGIENATSANVSIKATKPTAKIVTRNATGSSGSQNGGAARQAGSLMLAALLPLVMASQSFITTPRC